MDKENADNMKKSASMTLLSHSPSTSSFLNRTKSWSMYEVRGRMIAAVALVCLILLVVYIVPSTNGYSDVETVEFLARRPVRMPKLPSQDIDNKHLMATSSEIYAVVLDAGSTGSRVHVFHFKRTNGPLKLVREVFEQVKPGLSSYADDPKKGAESIRQLLNIALAEVPSELQPRTPVSLLATAGLRLLREGVADTLLKEVRNLIKEYPFLLDEEEDVDIMEGADEGMFSWLTISFMTGDFLSGRNNVAALDLGGGSSQITFIPNQQETLNTVPKDFIKSMELFKKKLNLYTHSYLGYGLMSTRFKLLGGNKKEKQQKLQSVCLPANIRSLWTFGGVPYNVSGESQSSFNSCYSVVKDFVGQKIQAVYELQKHEIYVFSYFYDAAVDSQLIAAADEKDSDLGGKLVVKDFLRAAKKAFDNPSSKKPFLGLDLLYMYSLLHDGYRLRSKTKVTVIKKIEHVEVSWGLGAAFELLSDSGMIS
ncbi:ENTPD5_6 [Mytilus coruscus]|uniref:ENTPD5_6 n=1 Tax=Mytilus coruscus TaxID=42192 RepID=A0A6J8EDX2_MYTCO|nr:ENTPD5_6 [Mytilus coruscus]